MARARPPATGATSLPASACCRQRRRREEREASERAEKWTRCRAAFAVGATLIDKVPDHWLKAGEGKRREKARAKVDEAGDAFFAHLQAISPRDWSSGVPVHWLYEELTWEDAVRPVGEKLSVVPPLAYGYTRPIV